MAIEYLGLSAINGPMVVLEGVSGAAYDEIVEMVVDGNKKSWAVSLRFMRTRPSFRYLKAQRDWDCAMFTPA
mgnify:CR=1 FL=1